MKPVSLTSVIVRRLLMLAIFLSLVALFSPPDVVRDTLESEILDCPHRCQAAHPQIDDLHREFDGLRLELARASATESPMPETLAETEMSLRLQAGAFINNRLAAVEALAALFCVRLAMLADSLRLLVLLTASTVIDALCLRRIAHQSFETSRPAVSFLSAVGFLTGLCAGAALLTVPITGAGILGIVVLSLSTLGLHCWIRYFHIL